ncbi:hypothetical protein DYB34_006096 [Aphanomyces astaci]|uniref:EF-hand domain-containing protein n=1 Tax=Aphanomyces astaci TaxID=112090 RepID=A0A418BUI0_APHAT|nr:hypothetical protein DYB34_006096 [Aphanomyces astaci]
MGLDLDNVAALHDVEDRRMTLDDFLTVVVDCNTQVKGHAESTVTQLCQLFHKIDHDEDGVITWTEFTSFVLETMRGYSEQLLVDGLHETLECMGSVNLKSKHSVTDMTFLSPRANAVVASLASTISILDISTNKLLNLLVGHRLGVTCIKYSVAYRYIISAGLDHDLRVRSHRHQVVGLTWVEDSPEVHSVDEAGFLKIWDLRTYRCIQTLCTLTATSATRSADAALKPTRYLPNGTGLVVLIFA